MANTNIGKTKRSTDEIIDGAIDRQQSWLDNRRRFTRNFLKRFNVFHSPEQQVVVKKKKNQQTQKQNNSLGWRAYWFPIVCALIVFLLAVFVVFFKINAPVKVVAPNSTPVPEPIVKTVNTNTNTNTDTAKTSTQEPKSTKNVNINHNALSFDLVRIEKSGNIIVAGRNSHESNVSIVINKKVVATEHTNKDGEFVYAPVTALKPGNYVLYLVDADKNIKSEDSVFLYISDQGYKNSVSLLMTKNGSQVMQAPVLMDGDLIVSKIDYLDTGRMVVTGKALPRLRVSLSLDDKYLGFARVSDYKNYGLGANVGKLESGKEYKLNIRLHDGHGTTIANIEHKFIMPEMTDDNNTFYTVRRGDCLWIIARNFLGRGVLFTMIAERNTIKNPDLIYPNQLLQIPLKN